MTLHRAVAHLVGAQSELRRLGLRSRLRQVDRAVYHVGQAIYGSNVHTVAEARGHILAAYQMIATITPAKGIRRTLRAALRELKEG